MIKNESMPIKWHQEGLKNSKYYAEQERIRINKLILAVEEQEKRNEFKELQIKTAIEKGMTEFDSDRFMRNKK